MKILKILFFLLLPFLARGQWVTSGGYPRTFPTSAQYAKNHLDSLSGRSFFFRYPKWFMRGDIVQGYTPADSAYFVSGVGTLTVSYDSSAWFNTATNSYWKKIGIAWQNTQGISLDSLLRSNNRWIGKNTFSDSLTAERGVKSGGVVDTKGVNTEGSSTQSAMTVQGAIAERDTIIDSDNFQTDWHYGIYTVKTLSANRTVRLPLIGDKNDWTLVLKNETLDLNGYTLTIKDSDNNTVYQLTGKILVKFKIKNLSWIRESVSFF